jgi:DNA invertase Pin-like site-specific DNA recombinase
MVTETAAQTPLRAGCYCRISSDPDDKREGVDRQREDTATLCEVKGWQVAGYYLDNDRSASTGKERPEWDRLLADVAAGEIDAIAAWDQDRGWRMMHELESLRKFFSGLGRRVPLATTGQGDIDLYSPTGVMMAQVKTAVSEHEVAMMSVRIRRAAKSKAEQGRPAWKVAFGYLPETRRREADDGTRQLDPRTAPLVRDAYRAVLSGASLKDVAAMWNDAGALTMTGKPWTTSAVSGVLRHPRNAGLRTHYQTGQGAPRKQYDIVGKGTWPPLVEESLWKAAQTVLDGRPSGGRGQRRSTRRHLLSGMLVCGRPECGAMMGAQRTTTGHVSYVCTTCYKVSARACYLEPLIYGLIGGRLAKPDAVDLLRKEAHDVAEAEAIRTEKASLYGRLDEMAVERAQGLLTARQVQVASEVVQQQIDALERKEQDQERLRVFDGIPLGTAAAVEAVKQLSPDRFRAVLSVLCTVTIKPVGKVGHVFDPERVKVDPL